MNPILHSEFWTIENADGQPMANQKGWVLVFSARENAQQMQDRIGASGAELKHYGGDYDVICFLERIGKLGAPAIVIDAGQPGAVWFSLSPETWNPDTVRIARAQAAGLELIH